MRNPIIIAVLCAVVLAACGETRPPVSEPPGPHLTVVAKDTRFDTAELAMVANRATLIYFTNLDGEQHNIAIYPNKDSGDALFVGELIGRGSVVYEVPPLAGGTYFFKCTVHPVMNGTVQVNP